MGDSNYFNIDKFENFNTVFPKSDSNVVDFIKFIDEDLMRNKDKKISIICKKKKLEEEYDFCFYNNINTNVNEEDIFGLHPSINEKYLLSIIKKYPIFSKENYESIFNILVEDFNNGVIKGLFNMHENHKKYLTSLFKYVVLNMLCHFGYYINKKENNDFVDDISKTDLFIEGVHYKLEDDFVFFMLGFNDNQLKYLNEHYYFKHKNGVVYCSNLKDGMKLDELINFKILKYSREHKSTFYSGVMPRVKKIEKKLISENQNILSFIYYVEQTTYATVQAFDYCKLIEHPYLGDEYEKLVSFFQEEDENINELMNNDGDCYEAVNNYLLKSGNTHCIAVSANIVSADDYLITTKRNKNMIDGGTIYCSVNGQSEFYNDSVSFYSESSLADMPTMRYGDNYRMDFEEELHRETIAELNVNQTMTNWKYYGICILGNSANSQTNAYRRRFHFCVLAENRILLDFEDIRNLQKYASESFENERIFGIDFRFKRTSAIKKYMNLFIENYTLFFDLVLSIIVIFVWKEIWDNISSIVLGTIALLIILFKFNSFIRELFKKLRYTLTINAFSFSNNGPIKIRQKKKISTYLICKFHKFIKREKSDNLKLRYHVLAQLMIYLYIVDRVKK